MLAYIKSYCYAFRNFNEEDAIEALSTFVSTNCCYDNGVTKNMKTKAILPTNGHQVFVKLFHSKLMLGEIWKLEVKMFRTCCCAASQEKKDDVINLDNEIKR